MISPLVGGASLVTVTACVARVTAFLVTVTACVAMVRVVLQGLNRHGGPQYCHTLHIPGSRRTALGALTGVHVLLKSAHAYANPANDATAWVQVGSLRHSAQQVTTVLG